MNAGSVARGITGSALLLTLTGCAAPLVWTKTNFTEEDFRRDRYECERDSRQVRSHYAPGSIMALVDLAEFSQQCMRARGYHAIRYDGVTRVVR